MNIATIDEVKKAVSESINKNKEFYTFLEEYDKGKYKLLNN